MVSDNDVYIIINKIIGDGIGDISIGMYWSSSGLDLKHEKRKYKNESENALIKIINLCQCWKWFISFEQF